MRTYATLHHGAEEARWVHTVTFASVNRFLVHLALSVQRAGGFLNVLGTLVDEKPLPAASRFDAATLEDYMGRGPVQQETDYRVILFKRLWWMRELAREIPDDDLVIFVDGHDVLFQKSLDDIVKSFERIVGEEKRDPWPSAVAAVGVASTREYSRQRPVVFSGFSRCTARFVGSRERRRYPIGSGKYVLGSAACQLWRRTQRRGLISFLDTGGYIGQASAVREVLEEAIALAQTGVDFICMTLMHVVGIARPDLVIIDSDASIFYTVTPLWKGEKYTNFTPHLARPLCGDTYFAEQSGAPPAHAVTGRTPAVLHFVGHAKWYDGNLVQSVIFLSALEAFDMAQQMVPHEPLPGRLHSALFFGAAAPGPESVPSGGLYGYPFWHLRFLRRGSRPDDAPRPNCFVCGCCMMCQLMLDSQPALLQGRLRTIHI